MAEGERIWRCSCGAGHFLTITKWGDCGDPIFILEGSFRGSFRRRLRQAVRHVLGRGHGDAWLELCLDDRLIREIRDHLNSLLPKDQKVVYTYNTAAMMPTISVGTQWPIRS